MLGSLPSRTSTNIVVTAAALMSLGVVLVFSANASLTAPSLLNEPLKNQALRQAAFTGIGLLVVLIVGIIPFEWWRIRRGSLWQPSLALLLLALALCAIVLVPGIGRERNGARRWLSFGPAAWGAGFQPSELAKLAVVVFTAGYAAWRGEGLRKFWTGLLPGLMVIGAFVGLVGKEDFGTAALIGMVGAAILLGGGARVWQLIICGLPAAIGMGALIALEPYRVSRLTSFTRIWDDPLGKGYHPVQSLMTIASGQWWGRGLGGGIQKYGYLPEASSDFIFAVICEELGLIGGAAVIGLFIVLVWQGRRAMLDCPDSFGRLLAFGAALTIGLQAVINVAVVTVSVPTKGIALPLVSAGGSGVVFLSALLGLLVNVARYRATYAEDSPAVAAPQAAGSPI